MTRAPCKHKFAVSKHFGISNFTTMPTYDANARKMYYFLATGKSLEDTFYGFSTACATSCLNMNFMKYFTYCLICVIFPDLPPPSCSKLQHPIIELTKIWLTLEYETLQTSNDLVDPWQVITLLICVFIIYFFCYKFFVWITFVCSWYFHFVAHDASTTYCLSFVFIIMIYLNPFTATIIDFSLLTQRHLSTLL